MQTAPTILLAEDDRILRKAAEATLKKAGYVVITVADGEEALARARGDKPDLMLLDVIMPKLQGFEVLARLKADASTRDIPIVMLTDLGQDSDRHAALQAGAAAYVVKSTIGLSGLVRAVATILGRDAP